ncbi:MAG: extracellular solute-binding protein [Treponema sp.]|jgi:ABC-type glycerol-3-phosphate transport system substrate-binding protein|nr:extracellular solute-binding protein [Treponema sp.]
MIKWLSCGHLLKRIWLAIPPYLSLKQAWGKAGFDRFSSLKGAFLQIKLKIYDILLIIAVIIVATATFLVKFRLVGAQGGAREMAFPVRTFPARDTLVLAHFWQDDAARNALQTLAEAFRKQNPDIFIEFRDYSYADMQDMLLVPLPGEITNRKLKDFASSDIFLFDPRWLSEMIRNNTLEPLADYIQEAENESAGEWAVPLTASIDLLFYNIDVLKAVGFERPPKNWTEFEKYAKVLSSPGRYGWTFSLVSDGYPEIYLWIWAAGAAMLKKSDDRAIPAFNNRTVVETLGFINSLKNAGVIAPNVSTKTKIQKFNEFTSSKAGMMIASVEDIEAVRRKMGDTSFGVTTIPQPDNFAGSRPVFGVRNAYAGIRKDSERKEEAWAFISYLAGHSPLLADAIHALPGNGNTPVSSKDDAFYKKVYDMYEGSEQMREFIDVPDVHILDAVVRDALAALFENGQLPDETARTIQGRWEEALEISKN